MSDGISDGEPHEKSRKRVTLGDGEGERFLELYGRYRGVVREELERTGLSPGDAERRVGMVFTRLSSLPVAQTDSDPMRAAIRTLVHEVTAAPEHRGASDVAAVSGPCPSPAFMRRIHVSGG